MSCTTHLCCYKCTLYSPSCLSQAVLGETLVILWDGHQELLPAAPQHNSSNLLSALSLTAMLQSSPCPHSSPRTHARSEARHELPGWAAAPALKQRGPSSHNPSHVDVTNHGLAVLPLLTFTVGHHHLSHSDAAIHCLVITMSRPHLLHVCQQHSSPSTHSWAFPSTAARSIPPHLSCALHQCFTPITCAWAVSSHTPHRVALAMARSPRIIQQDGLFNKSSCFPLPLALDDLGGVFQPE